MDNNPLNNIEKLSLEELKSYHQVTKITNRCTNIIGIAIMLFLLAFTSIVTLIPGGIFLYLLSHMSVGLTEMKNAIEERIVKLSSKS